MAARLFVPGDRRDLCLLVLGEAPGVHEDQQGRPFVGESGVVLKDWLVCCPGVGGRGIPVYVTNVVRCRPPQNSPPTSKQAKACRGYLEDDVLDLSAMYTGIIILAVGATAARSLAGCSQTAAFRRHKQEVDVGGVSCPVVYTYHPAYTLRGRNPTASHAVMDHLQILVDLIHKASTDAAPTVPRDSSIVDKRRKAGQRSRRSGGDQVNGPPGFSSFPLERSLPPEYRTCLYREGCTILPGLQGRYIPLGPISVDIETYGLLTHQPEQTLFVPAKSIHFDGVPTDKLVWLISIAWNTRRGVRSAVFDAQNPSHLEAFRGLVWREQHRGTHLLFKNAQFDLSYLRAIEVNLDHNTIVEDVDVLNYLNSDVRPERSLKSLVHLYGLESYGDGFRRYENHLCEEALEYSTKDAVETLKINGELRRSIAGLFGADSPKLSPETTQWYSNLIWCGVYMTEGGIPLDCDYLRREEKKLMTDLRRSEDILRRDGVPPSGKKSRAALVGFLWKCVEQAGVWTHPELEITPKTGQVCVNDLNLNLVLGGLPVGSPLVELVQELMAWKTNSKLLTTYLHPILGPYRRKRNAPPGCLDYDSAAIPVVGSKIARVHPRWYIVPAGMYSESGGSGGGTVQCRITCKGPALQTAPPRIKRAICPVKPGDYLLATDASQIEMRVAAIISGDSRMIREYTLGIDRHWLRAVEIFGALDGQVCPDHGGSYHKKCPTCTLRRYVGKTVNFEIIYWGGAYMMRSILRRDANFEVSVEFCEQALDKAYRGYPEFMAWCGSQIDKATSQGYNEEPILGASRWCTPSKAANRDEKSRIVNFPVQATAANIVLAGQIDLTRWLVGNGFKSRVVHNVYDALYVTGPGKELAEVRRQVPRFIQDSWYLGRVYEHYGHQVPILMEDSVKVWRGGRLVQLDDQSGGTTDVHGKTE